jgi:hypothetical protein
MYQQRFNFTVERNKGKHIPIPGINRGEVKLNVYLISVLDGVPSSQGKSPTTVHIFNDSDCL